MLSIVLTIIGLAAIIIFSIQVYRSARDNGRNAPLLAFINIAVGLAAQWLLPFMAMVAIVIFRLAGDYSIETFDSDMAGYALLLSFVGFVVSIVGMLQILKKASKIVEQSFDVSDGPPPPPDFN
jgi:predicted histidine transporter YuiF (NhaC family)